MKITIEKMDRPEHDGDWHDRPLLWIVNGPRDGEHQKFPTKREAMHYRTVRRCSDSQLQAIHSYVMGM